LTFSVFGDEDWFADFQGPYNQTQLKVGTYSNLRRYPFHNPVFGGLSWSGEGRGCNLLTGSFTVNDVAYESGGLIFIDLDFEQYCEESLRPLKGSVRWFKYDMTAPPGPSQIIPVGLWSPANRPASNTFVVLESTAKDFVGNGKSYSYDLTNALINVTHNNGQLDVRVAGNENWGAEFKAMQSATQLAPGYYANLQRYPFHNPVKGGLDWSGEGRGCNKLKGWLIVDSITFRNNELQTVDLRFEQYCIDSLAWNGKLHGAIRWTKPN
jgi:hypothetical protein